jgi:lactoylglutathione lyase
MTTTSLTDIRAVAVPANDQASLVAFYIEKLGFEKGMDAEIAPGFRWIEVAPPGARVSISIITSPTVGIDTGIRFTTPDARAEHAAMRERGIEVDDLLEMPDIPPMFSFHDADGNTLYVVQV